MAGVDISVLKHFISFDGLKNDAKSKNFSVYGKWLGIFSVLLCLALGISNIFRFDLIIIFSILAIVQGVLVLLVELPFLLKICPFNADFTGVMKQFNNNWPRVGFYVLLAVIQWLSLVIKATSLITLAVLWTFCAIMYAISAATHQEFHNGTEGAGIAAVSDIPPSAIRQVL
ncbi:Tvp18 protein [Saccharomycopsis crataegensis]|uniref:Golgi apparatus membrane protein TVP18 n=1 Tax=Saccharomycopsis crataegensis TaxID=43959 RepID=A0AAV5QFC6_9ASCO|nr:Tvp18 protein [Saccharomycopsis crataegensis]